jgi:glycosyltransferase involved in cell wall biosynthesis
MRIAYLLSEYPHIRHAYLMREIRGLRDLGMELQVVAVRPDPRRPEQQTAAEREEQAHTHYVLGAGRWKLAWAHVRTLFTRPRGYLRGIASTLQYGRFHPVRTFYAWIYLTEALAAGWWIQDQQLSHVHTHYASTLAWLMARVFGLPVSMTIHGSGEFDDPEGFRLLEKVEIAQFVRAISFFGRSQIMRAVPYSEWGKIELCRLGVDPAEFGARPFRVDPHPFELLCVGGMARPRAFETLIQAVAVLARQKRNVVLRLVGDGLERPALEQLADSLGLADCIVFEGWQSQNQLPSFYERADAFVLSTFAEGIPVVLMEAMAMEIPCIATQVAGIPELVRDGIDGLLVAPSDEHGLAGAVTRLMDDPKLRLDLGRAARAHILKDYDLRRNLQALSAIFRRRFGGVAADTSELKPNHSGV